MYLLQTLGIAIINLKDVSFAAVIIIVLYEFLVNLGFFAFQLKPSTGNFCDLNEFGVSVAILLVVQTLVKTLYKIL